MANAVEAPVTDSGTMHYGLRARIARLLGVEPESKENLYLELSRGATLYDLVYWLQILFSAGIATLGLVMNSPAVIIGAMLISPLMGPILATGLALASGDVVLGVRSITKIAISCSLAMAFAIFLVAILPFREMTAEISARTQPNTLDLFIALFSGAVGSIAVCREVKGVATSIPGVAIAVALMPPLCVAGYGLGLIVTTDTASGWRVASGGGLLFLTNLFAITFTAMVVFLLVKLSTAHVRKRAEEWEHNDPESAFVLSFIERFPKLEKAREIRSLPMRFLTILLPLVVISIPLGQSFLQLRNEVAQQRRENRTRKEILEIWQEKFQNKPNGHSRSTVDQLSLIEKDGVLRIDLRLFDDEPYTADEKKTFADLVSKRLSRPADSINVRLTEIPTTLGLATLREREESSRTETLPEIQTRLLQEVDNAMRDVELPENAQLLGRQLVIDGTNAMHIRMVFLCPKELAPEVKNTIAEKIRGNLKDERTKVSLDRIPAETGYIDFPRGSTSLPILGMLQLDYVGRLMRENPELLLEIGAGPQGGRNDVTARRIAAIREYLTERWQVLPESILDSEEVSPEGKIGIVFRTARTPATRDVQPAAVP